MTEPRRNTWRQGKCWAWQALGWYLVGTLWVLAGALWLLEGCFWIGWLHMLVAMAVAAVACFCCGRLHERSKQRRSAPEPEARCPVCGNDRFTLFAGTWFCTVCASAMPKRKR